MEQPFARIKWSSVKTHPNGAISFELETVPYRQAYEEAMENAAKLLDDMYKQDPSSFRCIMLDFSKP